MLTDSLVFVPQVFLGTFIWALVFGLILWIGKPKGKNMLLGYKTKRAMVSDESFAIANTMFYSHVKIGFWVFLSAAFIHPFFIHSIQLTLHFGLISFYLFLLYTIVKIERKLKASF